MALIDFKTNLKSLKFGKDRPQEGSSNQPYIVKEIPTGETPGSSPDFLVRDPLGLPKTTANDLSRLTQMFADTKSPNGLLFIAKQELLSKTAVKTQASVGVSTALGLINGGIYLPTSTLAQVAGVAEGLHLAKQGINPALGTPGSLVTYSDELESIKTASSNRLITFYNAKQIDNGTLPPPPSQNGIINFLSGIDQSVDNLISNVADTLGLSFQNDLYSYNGGPGSVLGVGKTHIRFADQRTGINNTYGKEILNLAYQTSGSLSLNRDFSSKTAIVKNTSLGIFTYNTSLAQSDNKELSNVNFIPTLGASFKYFKKLGVINNQTPEQSLRSAIENAGINPDDGTRFNVSGQTYTPTSGLGSTVAPENFVFDGTTLNKVADETNYRFNNKVIDFRKKIAENFSQAELDTQNILSSAPDYTIKNIENRVLLGDPGNRLQNGKPKNVFKYGVDANTLVALDKINAQDIATTLDPKQVAKNDLVKFRITTWDNDGEGKKYIFFRAFIDSFSDSYNADWAGFRYSGRGEEFFNYNGFSRKISLSFTVAAQSKAELIPMYRKLNYLASNLAPDYSKGGFMRAPIVALTMGGYVYEQPGFINSLTYQIPENSPWEIAIPDGSDTDGAFEDRSVKELPHIIKVSSFEFTPIHEFIPRKNRAFPNQESKFISLSAGGATNYPDQYLDNASIIRDANQP